MLRKSIRDFLRKMGMLDEDISDETIDMLVKQLLQILDTPDLHQLQNALNIKTGAVLHQFILSNQQEIRTNLLEQIRTKEEKGSPIPLKLSYRRTCLYIGEDGRICSVAKKDCPYNKEIQNCDVVQASLEPDLEPWK